MRLPKKPLKNINNEIDVYLMDINLPVISGFHCVSIIREKKPNVQIVMQTVYENDEEIIRSVLARANGYLLKTTPPVKLLEAIIDVYNGGSPMSSQIVRKQVNAFSKMEKPPESIKNYNGAKMMILSLLAKGFKFKDIARETFYK